MANKDLYLSNTELSRGPSELANLAVGGRALILGRNIDLLSVEDIRQYFTLIIAEDVSYSAGLPAAPDITIWQPGSPYLGGVYSFPTSTDSLYMVNRQTLKKIADAGAITQTYNLGYLQGGTKSNQPGIINYIPAGLDTLAPGQHLGMIAGITSFYDTEGRSGTIACTAESIKSAVNAKNGYGVSSFYLNRRFSLLEQI